MSSPPDAPPVHHLPKPSARDRDPGPVVASTSTRWTRAGPGWRRNRQSAEIALTSGSSESTVGGQSTSICGASQSYVDLTRGVGIDVCRLSIRLVWPLVSKGIAMRRIFIGLLVVVASSVFPAVRSAEAQQASWTRTHTASCTSQSGYISFRRGAPNGWCYTNRAFGADANLRTSGSDVYLDNFFIGTTINNPANTWSVHSRWTVSVSLCSVANFFTTRAILDTDDVHNVLFDELGMMSYRSTACIN